MKAFFSACKRHFCWVILATTSITQAVHLKAGNRLLWVEEDSIKIGLCTGAVPFNQRNCPEITTTAKMSPDEFKSRVGYRFDRQYQAKLNAVNASLDRLFKERSAKWEELKRKEREHSANWADLRIQLDTVKRRLEFSSANSARKLAALQKKLLEYETRLKYEGREIEADENKAHDEYNKVSSARDQVKKGPIPLSKIESYSFPPETKELLTDLAKLNEAKQNLLGLMRDIHDQTLVFEADSTKPFSADGFLQREAASWQTRFPNGTYRAECKIEGTTFRFTIDNLKVPSGETYVRVNTGGSERDPIETPFPIGVDGTYAQTSGGDSFKFTLGQEGIEIKEGTRPIIADAKWTCTTTVKETKKRPAEGKRRRERSQEPNRHF